MRLYFALILALLTVPASAQRLLIVSGNAQLVPEQFLANQPLVVRAVNAAGQGVANVPVQWQGPALGQVSQVTDASGNASAIVGGLQLFQGESYVASKYTATAEGYGTVEFTETTFSTRTRIGGSPDRFHPDAILIPVTTDITGPPGTVVPRAFGIRVLAAAGLNAGVPIPNVGIRVQEQQQSSDPTAVCQGPNNLAFTNAQGEAYCDLVLGSTPATGFIRAIIGEDLVSPLIPVSITAGTPCSYTATANPQSFAGAGGAGSVAVTSGQNCSWTVSTAASWITVTSTATGQGNGNVTFSVAANTGGARSGSILLADRTITISQAAAGSNPGGGALTFTSISPIPSSVVGSGYTYQFGATGGTAPYTWSATGILPPGLGLNPNTGVLTGTPSVAGTYAFNVTARDATGLTVTAPFSATVGSAGTGTLQITTTSIAAGVVGTAYNQTLTTTGACSSNPFSGGVVNWSVISGSLPPGLTLSPSGSSTTITGTPTQAGSYTSTLQAASQVSGCSRVANQTFVTTITTSGTPPPNQNTMVVTPSAIEISVAYTAATSPVQQVTVQQTGSAQIPYTITTNTPWISVSKSQGTTPDSFELRAVNIGAFTPGQHNGSITITSSASNSPVTVPVTLRVASPANITLGPESLLFQHTLASPFSSQNLQINSVVAGGRTPFTIEWESDGGGTWLSVNPTAGETPRIVSVVVDTSRLGVGTYRGTIRVRPTGNAGGTVLVPVTAVVTPVSVLNIAQRQLTFNGPGSQSLSIASTGTPLNFTATTSGGAWLTVEPASGITPGFLNIGTNASGLAPGTYNGTVTVTPSNGGDPIQIAVTFNVSAGQPAITGVTNAASFAPGAIAPGELVTIFGSNLGPTQLISGTYDSAGRLATSVSNVQVQFDGISAPIIHTVAGQVTTIVPFGVFGRTTTRVQVLNNGLSSNTVDVAVVEAAPGVFMLDTAGQGAIINQDGTINARLNGAEPGSVISIYATGAGRMEGTLADGSVVLGTPKPLLPVGVRIGGRVADVTYAGAAPGLVAGMLQVNARVPADTPRGTTVPVQIIVGNATSQTNVFLATRP